MKNQTLFSSKDKSEKLECRLLQCLFGVLWVKIREKYGDVPLHHNPIALTRARNLHSSTCIYE